ncbi:MULTISPECIES: hypothetical protein [Metallibacterium]|jgi:hypothetical protein|uniref:hypothetical protein n=1 Tax=Metallibacterium TaxID=1218803 RepID=UPI0026261179|nr:MULTISPECIES: hypothetical protein [Metallibacterium]MBW8075776.1 hypothetical protein [Metallibacterium scheffleri]
MAHPGFTADQRRRLAKLDVLPEQIERLRNALVEVKRTLPRLPKQVEGKRVALPAPATRDAVQRVLEDVVKHADALARILAKCATQADAAHAKANSVIERAYWMAFPDDDGPWSAHHMLPRLKVLADAARHELEAMPKDQARSRVSLSPIMWIDHALRDGWIRAQGPRKVRVIDGEKVEALPEPYPKEFRPHESETFMEIVAVCYEAAGAQRDFVPTAAIRAYAQGKKRLRDGVPLPGLKVRSSAKRGRRQ